MIERTILAVSVSQIESIWTPNFYICIFTFVKKAVFVFGHRFVCFLNIFYTLVFEHLDNF